MSKDIHKTAALASLTETYTDSEGSAAEYSDEEDDSQSANNNSASNRFSLTVPDVSDEKSSRDSTPQTKSYSIASLENKKPALLVSYSTNEGIEDGDKEINANTSLDNEPMDESPPLDSKKNENENKRAVSPITFHRSLLLMKTDEIQLPPDYPGRCSNALQEKFAKHLEKKVKEGKNMNDSIQRRKDFRNPSIYEKLIAYCGIDEMGTNYPPEIYDPHCWGAQSFYDELAKRQKEEMDKKEKERKEKTKVEFISGTAKKPQADSANSAIELAMKRRSKWDMGATQGTALPVPVKPATLITPSVVPITSAQLTTKPTNNKPTIISAFGTITKKKV